MIRITNHYQHRPGVDANQLAVSVSVLVGGGVINVRVNIRVWT